MSLAPLHVVYGILAALLARERGADGPFQVEVPMFETMVAFLMNEHLAAATFSAEGAPGYPRLLSPDRWPFRTADGWIAVLPYTEAQWRRFLAEIAREAVCDEPWFGVPQQRQAHIGKLYAIVAESLTARSTAAWITLLEARDIPCSRVALPADLLSDPHLCEIGFFDVPADFPDGVSRSLPQPVAFPGSTVCGDSPPHAIGADSRAVLHDCGHDEAAIDALIASGAVR